jgi:hypothetical protein
MKYPYQVLDLNKQCYLFYYYCRYYGNSLIITCDSNSCLELLSNNNKLNNERKILKICTYNEEDNNTVIVYFKGVEHIQRLWRRKKIKKYFNNVVARELMEFCYHPSRLSFQV